jgi:D-alanyl-D-alanine carboxypeptidase
MSTTPRLRRARRAIAVLLIVAIAAATAVAVSLTLARRQMLAAVAASTTASTSTAFLTVTEPGPDGTWTSGSPHPGSTEPPSGDESFRIGSITKTFVATTILQLVDEGRIELDRPIGTYPPDVVPNGTNITVRQILNHTSGLYDYMKGKGWSTNRWRGDDRFTTYSPDQLLTEAFRHEPYFPPGTGFRYSNTNYIVAGKLIEAVTGQPYSTVIEHRILRPLNLTDTSFPGRAAALPEPAIHATATLDNGQTVDVAEQNVSLDWAAGEMISTSHDLQTFFEALLGGDLISEDSLAQMRTTVPMAWASTTASVWSASTCPAAVSSGDMEASCSDTSPTPTGATTAGASPCSSPPARATASSRSQPPPERRTA